MPVNH
ncbi:hypothetical protein A6R68_24250 [Neotoma lepida]